jgi:hypothetical protein
VKFLVTLKANEDLPHQRLVLRVLSLCPELIPQYLSAAPFSLEPRGSIKWVQNTVLLMKVLRVSAFRFAEGTASVKPSDVIGRLVPDVITRTNLSLGLQHANKLVKYYTMLLMCSAFDNITRLLPSILPAIPTGPARATWMRSLSDELRKRMPDVQILIALAQQFITQAAPEEGTVFVTSSPLWNHMVLSLVLGYQTYIESAIAEANFDRSKLLQANLSQLALPTQVKVMQCLIASPDFRWSQSVPGRKC